MASAVWWCSRWPVTCRSCAAGGPPSRGYGRAGLEGDQVGRGVGQPVWAVHEIQRDVDTGGQPPLGAKGGRPQALKSNGTLNWPLIQDFASAGMHDMSVAGKAVTAAFYVNAPGYSHFMAAPPVAVRV